MKEEYRKIIKERKGQRLSIGINEDGEYPTSIYVPWEGTANAFSMILPKIYLTPRDLENDELMAEIGECDLVSVYVDIPLDDYSFLRNFPLIEDLSIKHGDNVTDLSFLEPLSRCRMFFIENAKLKNLDVIVKHKLARRAQGIFTPFPYYCLGQWNCYIEDPSSLFQTKECHFNEFIVWDYEEQYDRSRWSEVRAMKLRHYRLKKE